jgi:hypothetical protein
MFIFLSIQGQGTQEWQPGMRGSIEHQIRGDFDARFRWSSKSPAACKQGGKRSKTLWNSCALRWKYIIWIHIILCICNIYIYHYTSYVHVCTGVRTIDYLMGSLEGAFNSWSSCLHHRESECSSKLHAFLQWNASCLQKPQNKIYTGYHGYYVRYVQFLLI